MCISACTYKAVLIHIMSLIWTVCCTDLSWTAAPSAAAAAVGDSRRGTWPGPLQHTSVQWVQSCRGGEGRGGEGRGGKERR